MDTDKYKIYGTLKSVTSTRGLDQPLIDYDNDKAQHYYFIGSGPINEIEKELIGKAVTTDSKFNMIDLGAFGVIINGNYDIYGEVYEGGEDFLAYCDMIEGQPKATKQETFMQRFSKHSRRQSIYITRSYYGEDYPALRNLTI